MRDHPDPAATDADRTRLIGKVDLDTRRGKGGLRRRGRLERARGLRRCGRRARTRGRVRFTACRRTDGHNEDDPRETRTSCPSHLRLRRRRLSGACTLALSLGVSRSTSSRFILRHAHRSRRTRAGSASAPHRSRPGTPGRTSRPRAVHRRQGTSGAMELMMSWVGGGGRQRKRHESWRWPQGRSTGRPPGVLRVCLPSDARRLPPGHSVHCELSHADASAVA